MENHLNEIIDRLKEKALKLIYENDRLKRENEHLKQRIDYLMELTNLPSLIEDELPTIYYSPIENLEAFRIPVRVSVTAKINPEYHHFVLIYNDKKGTVKAEYHADSINFLSSTTEKRVLLGHICRLLMEELMKK
ncbi:MAG: DNA replication initiation control protein YabA [Calditrichaeota bacterium]|nr:DNA replication initiation control protein YabA [Calditrichota bacterium]